MYRIKIIGPPCMIRTCDQRIRSPLLYPAELRAELQVNDVFFPGHARYADQQ